MASAPIVAMPPTREAPSVRRLRAQIAEVIEKHDAEQSHGTTHESAEDKHRRQEEWVTKPSGEIECPKELMFTDDHEARSARRLRVQNFGETKKHDAAESASEKHSRQEAWIMKHSGVFECPMELMLSDEDDDQDLDEEDQAFLRNFAAEVEAAYATRKVQSREVDMVLYEYLFGQTAAKNGQLSDGLAKALAGAAGRALLRRAIPDFAVHV
eukprot:CAMPEP_0170211662 /NCGR_PEP_ID=MMETSP0116_2-20130129/5447_1 /TAXON_ID=400756 /ORGANISM="Durinskia baltica, Strain CSIRO CS-38" /LENGTH=211 /DNA_ID=CAMNT_0010462197 /DNA_START=41 /DNA_END=676 /DNA_ORIENTATION=+